MAYQKIKLGKLIQQCDNRNTDLILTEEDVRGISTGKEFIATKADLDGVNVKSYKIIRKNEFAYVADTSRRGEKIALAFNRGKDILISSIYTSFYVDRSDLLLSDYLFMYFNRPEFDRYSRFNSWGSARETFNWEEMCDIEIELPSIEIQQKYIDVYNAMLENQKSYERGLDDLELACTAKIEKLKIEVNLHRIGEYITPYNVKNTDGKIKLEQGINIDKQFIMPQRANSNLTGRKVVKKGMFAYCTQLNNENVALAYRTQEDCVVSGVYDVFEITQPTKLIPEYLLLWLIRLEFGRFVYWASEGSAYEFLAYSNLANYEIPIPDIKIQKSIANIYKVYKNRKEINEKLKSQIKTLCPILIKGSIEEAKLSK